MLLKCSIAVFDIDMLWQFGELDMPEDIVQIEADEHVSQRAVALSYVSVYQCITLIY